MEPVGLLSLPDELIGNIARYLSVQDVLSCSLTCHYLRTTLNYNSVWKKYLPQSTYYLDPQEQQVSPPFHMEGSITPLCSDRQYFARITRVINNWREGRCVKFNSHCEHPYTDDFNGRTVIIYEDKYMFCCRFTSNTSEYEYIDVWEISKDPTPVVNLNFGVRFDCFFIVGPYLVVVQRIKVFVYCINLPNDDFPLKFTFIITEKYVNINEGLKESDYNDNKYKQWSHSVANQYLVSKKNEQNVLHIWDIKSASKIGCFESQIANLSIYLMSCVGQNLLFAFKINMHLNTYLSVFNIGKLEFNNSIFSDNECSHFSHFDTFVIVFKSIEDPDRFFDLTIVCSNYDLNSSLKLNEKKFFNANNYFVKSIIIVNGKFVLQINHCLHIIDALSLETTDKFQYYDSSVTIKQIDLFKSLVLVMLKYNDELEFWDVFRKKKLPINLIYLRSHLYLDSLCTKLVINDMECVNVVHFW